MEWRFETVKRDTNATAAGTHLFPDSSSSPNSLIRKMHKNVHQHMYSKDIKDTMCFHMKLSTDFNVPPASIHDTQFFEAHSRLIYSHEHRPNSSIQH